VLVADDQLDPAQAALLQAGHEPAPERLVLAVTHIEAEHLTGAVGGDPGGDHDRHRGHLAGPAVRAGGADVEVGGVEVDVGELAVAQGPGPKGPDDLVEPFADPRDLGLADSRPDAEGLDQVIDAAGRDPVDVGLHHHRVQRLVDPAAGFEDHREERAFAELGDPQLQVAGLGGQRSWTGPVAFGDPLIGALIAGGADPLRGFGFDQLLQHELDRLADQVHAITGTERLEQLRHGRLG